MALKFEWDPDKADSNLRKHGVAFEEATTVFGDPLGRITPDMRHSEGEARFALLGLSASGRFLTVMFCERGESLRLISARPATPRERREYEKKAT